MIKPKKKNMNKTAIPKCINILLHSYSRQFHPSIPPLIYPPITNTKHTTLCCSLAERIILLKEATVMSVYSFQKGFTWSATMRSWLPCESTIHTNGRLPSRILSPAWRVLLPTVHPNFFHCSFARSPMADTSGGRRLGSLRRLLRLILFYQWQVLLV